MFYFWSYIWIGIFIGVPVAGVVYRETYINFTDSYEFKYNGVKGEDRLAFIGWALLGFAACVLLWLPVLTLVILSGSLWFIGLALVKTLRLKKILEPEVKR